MVCLCDIWAVGRIQDGQIPLTAAGTALRIQGFKCKKQFRHEREATGQRRKRYLKITMNKDRERVKKSFGSLLVTTSWLQAQAKVNLLNGDSHWLSLCFTMAWPPVEAARVHTWPDMRRISSPGHHLHTTGSGQWVLNRAAKKESSLRIMVSLISKWHKCKWQFSIRCPIIGQNFIFGERFNCDWEVALKMRENWLNFHKLSSIWRFKTETTDKIFRQEMSFLWLCPKPKAEINCHNCFAGLSSV